MHNKGGDSCFIGGTKVLLPDGSHRNIEHITIGDKVVSYDESDGTNRVCSVVQTMQHLVDEEIYTICSANEKIEATGIHRFYIKRDGVIDWIPASDLLESDQVMISDGTWHNIDSIKVDRRSVKVYNFEVSGNHNYYVGEHKGILAHNKNYITKWYYTSFTHSTYCKHWNRKVAIHTGVPSWQEDITEEYKTRHSESWETEEIADEPNVVKRVEPTGEVKFIKLHFGEMDNTKNWDWYFFPEITSPNI